MTPIEETGLLITIGKNLHSIRNARKETLQGVASNIGVSHPIISKIENGRYNSLQISLLIKLCNHYQISLQQVFSLEIANVFQLTQHNNDGTNKLIGQELENGYVLYTQQLKKENDFMRKQIETLMEKLK